MAQENSLSLFHSHGKRLNLSEDLSNALHLLDHKYPSIHLHGGGNLLTDLKIMEVISDPTKKVEDRTLVRRKAFGINSSPRIQLLYPNT